MYLQRQYGGTVNSKFRTKLLIKDKSCQSSRQWQLKKQLHLGSQRQQLLGYGAIKEIFFIFICVDISTLFEQTANKITGGAAIAQWIRLRLPSCRPGFKSQAHHLCFFNYSNSAIFVM